MNSLHRQALMLADQATKAFNSRGASAFPSPETVPYQTAVDRNAQAQASLITAIARFTAIGGNVLSTLNAAKTISDAELATLTAHG